MIEGITTNIFGLLTGFIISGPILYYYIRKTRQEDRELNWFRNLPLSEQDKIVTNDVVSDDILKQKIKFIYNIRRKQGLK